eukprot:6049119-Pyramimonas_sp.AAC.1
MPCVAPGPFTIRRPSLPGAARQLDFGTGGYAATAAEMSPMVPGSPSMFQGRGEASVPGSPMPSPMRYELTTQLFSDCHIGTFTCEKRKGAIPL